MTLNFTSKFCRPISPFTMLAPRKKLWSSPNVAVEAAVRLLDPQPDDVMYDIGCGDGLFLVTCALACGCKCVGIEIDDDRAKEAEAKVNEAGRALCIVPSFAVTPLARRSCN